MSLAISNIHLRVPRGFGALLEGLTREILRDQPKDIPKYAAKYFETLLKSREESGTDPSEWAATLEDRYDSHQAYKPSELASQLTVLNKTSNDSTAEDYSGLSESDVPMATDETSHDEEVHLMKNKEEESSPNITQAESVDGPPVTSPDPKASTHTDVLSNEIDNSVVSSQNNSLSETHDIQLLKEGAIHESKIESVSENVDCQLIDQEEDKPGSVNICDMDLQEETADADSVMEEDAEQEEAHQLNEVRPVSPVSQMEIIEQQPKESSDDTSAVVPNYAVLDDNQDKSLIEIDFDDVPENQQSTDNENELNMETFDKADDDAMLCQGDVELGNEKGNGKEDTDSNPGNDRDENDDTIGTGNSSKTKVEEDQVEGEDTENIDNEKSSQVDNFERNFDFTYDTTLTGEDTNESETEEQPEMEHENSVGNDCEMDSTLVESSEKIMEKAGDDVPENNEEEQQQSLEKYFAKELDSDKEELEEEVRSDAEDIEGLSSCQQDSINQDLDETRVEKETHLHEDHKDNPDPEGDLNDTQEECSRPQEEEDIMDIPLDDPEANRAAAKIQAGFRGHMTRKKMKPEDKTEGEERQEDQGQ